MPEQEFLIDKITDCIEEKATSKTFPTVLQLVTKEEISKIHKKDGWLFNWKTAYTQANHQVYKLVMVGNPQIQGLISLEPIKSQQYIELHLIESAPHNYGAKKQFAGVPGNLVAFACKMSFELGFDGFVAFTAKTQLINHYIQTLGAQLLYGYNRMGIFTEDAKKLVNSYYQIILMTNKKKYYQLDDVRIVGTQEKKSALVQKNHERKTGEIFRKARTASSASHKVKKAS